MSGRGGRAGGRGNPTVRGTWRGGRGREGHTRFSGACEGLKGCVFDATPGRQAETFKKNMRRITDYVQLDWPCVTGVRWIKSQPSRGPNSLFFSGFEIS